MRSQTLAAVSLVSLAGLAICAATLPACVGPDGGAKPDDETLLDLASPIEGGVADFAAAADLTATNPDQGAGPKVIRFAAMGDTGKGNTGQKDVASAIARKCAASGCDFVQLLGDNIYDSGVTSVTDPQWQTKFEQPYADIDLPFYAALGNHDNGGSLLGFEIDPPRPHH